MLESLVGVCIVNLILTGHMHEDHDVWVGGWGTSNLCTSRCKKEHVPPPAIQTLLFNTYILGVRYCGKQHPCTAGAQDVEYPRYSVQDGYVPVEGLFEQQVRTEAGPT